MLKAIISICGIACLMHMIAQGAETQALPPIFAMPAKPESVPSNVGTRNSQLSERVHRLMSHALKVQSEHAAPAASARPIEAAEGIAQSQALVMEKVVVRSTVPETVELPKVSSKLDKFQRTGTFVQRRGEKFTFDGMFYIDRWYSNREGSGGTETRAEIKFNLRW
jgi:hypothetical protein